MDRTLISCVLLLMAAAGCPGPSGMQPLPQGPPPEYEAPRSYDPKGTNIDGAPSAGSGEDPIDEPPPALPDEDDPPEDPPADTPPAEDPPADPPTDTPPAAPPAVAPPADKPAPPPQP